MALRVKSAGDRPVVFMHLHKTGGMWVRHTLKAIGVAGNEIGLTHSQLPKVRRREPDAFLFGFVRDPFDFLRSYYLHRQRRGWHPSRDLDQVCRAETLTEFLDLYLAHLPGWVGRWFDLYVDGIEFVGRQEHLREDLCSALDLAGVEYDRELVMGMKPVHVTPRPQDPAVTDLGDREAYYREAVRAAEAYTYSKWYPTPKGEDPAPLTGDRAF
jgi:hypothetical protein